MRTRSLLIGCMGLLACGGKDTPGAPATGGRDGGADRAGGSSRGGAGTGGAGGSGGSAAGGNASGGSGGGGAGGGTGPIDAALDVPVTMSDAPVTLPVDMAAPSATFSCTNLPRPADPYRLVNPFPQLPPFEQPSGVVQAPGQPQFWYVIEQGGSVKRFANRADVSSAAVVLDLTNRVDSEGDAGILAITFHPKFGENGQMFLSYALAGATLRSRLSRFTSTNGGTSFDPGSEEVLIEIPQGDPEKIHLNCDMRFGPDGFLWAGFGDGGYGEDSRNEAQNLGTINGKILRIDVDRREGGRPYAIPSDNPFVGRAGARGEVWAVGFRNPWRWRFDPTQAGVLWVGELGSDRREELDRVVRGGNYGWNRLEGSLCLAPPCNTAGLTPPHVEYKHSEGKSITAGPVYRGQMLPGLRDRVIYGDFVSGNVWALPADRSPQPEVVLATQLALVSFGEALDEELYLVDYDGGRIHKVAPGEGGAALPAQLSGTGCLDKGAATPHLIPYDVNAPLWSDGASKRRWMALPAGGKITVAADGDFQFPGGSTLVKEFSVGNTRTETRLFVRHADGNWVGYSYAWNPEQTDATLVGLTSAPLPKTVGGATWHHPSRSHCMVCHTPDAGYTLGLEVAQLNRTFNYPDGPRNQLTHLQQAGLLAAPLAGAPGSLPALPVPDGGGAIGPRARAYLHANCSSCHRPNRRFPDGIDLRFTTSLQGTKTCNQESVYGGFDGAVNRLVPGQPEASVLTRFMKTNDEFRMPLVGTTQVDQAGVAVVEGWIKSLSGCP
jgi:uncharacterized repeat protein (TIGR03806 family)